MRVIVPAPSSLARRVSYAMCAAAVLVWAVHTAHATRGTTEFASAIARLSEPEGRFDTDNLISNERSYLDVIPTLVSNRVSGGAYIGVGPDQNFSYIARIRPTVAYIIDIRRDNLLLHLLFKALFARSSTRIEYLSQLTGRDPPSDVGRWRHASIRDIAEEIEAQTPVAAHVDDLRRRLEMTLTGFGVPLSRDDLETIDRFHRAFIERGLGLRFQSFGRPPMPYYPTYRELLLATDATGHEWSFLASEDDFRFVKSLEGHNAIVPVVGNVAGTHAMRAIAGAITARGQRVTAFYVSNIESYLYRTGQVEQFIENVARLPQDAHSILIRSVFGRGGTSTSIVEPLARGR